MKKFICIILVAIISFGSVYAAPFQQPKVKHGVVKKKTWKAKKVYKHKIAKKKLKKVYKHPAKKKK